MVQLANIQGMGKVLSNLQKAEKELAARAAKGLMVAGLFLQRKSQQIVPVDNGILINSSLPKAVGKGFDTEVTVGYTTFYAVYVHENMTARHAPGKTAKFLETPFKENREEMIKIVYKVAKL